MNIGNITSDNFNLDGNGKDIQIEVYEQLIEQLQQENKILKAINEQHRKINGKLREENQKYKEVIDKIDKYINDYNVFEVFSFPLMKRWEEEQVKSSIDYEFKTSLIKDLKDILKEASE